MITEIRLLKVPLEADYKHTIYFGEGAEGKNAQEEYFKERTFKIFNDCSYQRKDKKIRVPMHYDDIAGNCNYVMYNNKGKWYYAFITHMEYINDEVTDVFIETDVMQTWYYECEVKACFVEREHVADDTRGANTVPEQLETGEYTCNNVIQDKSTDGTVFIVASTVDISTGEDSGMNVYNGIATGWYYYWFDTLAQMEAVLKDVATLRTNDCIVNIFVMPKNYIHTVSGSNKVLNSWDIPKHTVWDTIKKPNTVNGYEPKNAKVLTYPYSYLLIDNNSGGVATYKYELFDMDNPELDRCDFVIYGCITPGGSIRAIPNFYNGSDGGNYHFGLNGGKYPVCGWQGDYYTNWLTQNSLNLEVQAEAIHLAGASAMVDNLSGLAGAGGNLGMGIVTRNPQQIGSGIAGAVGGLAKSYLTGAQVGNQIKGLTAMKEIHAFQSPTVGGSTNSGDINFCMGNIRFTAYQMSIKKEYARIIDGYFHMYGYQVNRVKVPNKNHRENWWYTKTCGCEIDGNIPNADMQIIKQCYDNGITFWKDPLNIAYYCNWKNELVDNPII